jgi:hypothetical protein
MSGGTERDGRTFNCFILTKFSTPTSHISNKRLSKVLAKMRLSGRFLEFWPTTNIEASFFRAQNSNEE